MTPAGPDPHALEAVRPIEATRALELMECSAAWVRPQQVSTLVKTLAASMRQPALSHLKRVCRKPPPPGSAAAGREGPPSIGVLLWHGGPEELGALPASLQAPPSPPAQQAAASRTRARPPSERVGKHGASRRLRSAPSGRSG